MSFFRATVSSLLTWRVGAAVLAVALVVAGGWLFRAELMAMWGVVSEWIRAAGPLVYFTVMALVPLPLAWLTVPAGELFAEQLTLPGVIAAAMAAVVVQLSLSYLVARHGLRPVAAGWLKKRGYNVPVVTRENAVSVVLLVRLLPGPPMILGSCLLAVAETPFAIYLALSTLVALPWVCGGVMLGHGIMNGQFTQVITGAGVLVALVIGVRLFRRRKMAQANGE
ncbi:MAG: VTT domain-containing protein [Rariglobus sp.]